MKRITNRRKDAWTQAEDATIERVAAYATPEQLMAEIPGRTWIAIHQHAKKLGVTLPASADSDSSPYKAISLYFEAWQAMMSCLILTGEKQIEFCSRVMKEELSRLTAAKEDESTAEPLRSVS